MTLPHSTYSLVLDDLAPKYSLVLDEPALQYSLVLDELAQDVHDGGAHPDHREALRAREVLLPLPGVRVVAKRLQRLPRRPVETPHNHVSGARAHKGYTVHHHAQNMRKSSPTLQKWFL